MSKATFLPASLDFTGKLHGYKYPLFFTDLVPVIAAFDPLEGRCMRPLVVIHVETVGWQGHPLFKRMSRSYAVTVMVATSENGFALNEDSVCLNLWNASWKTVLEEIRALYVRGYHYTWGDTTPFLSILDGGYSDRICREILAVCPHHDLQGRGDGQ